MVCSYTFTMLDSIDGGMDHSVGVTHSSESGRCVTQLSCSSRLKVPDCHILSAFTRHCTELQTCRKKVVFLRNSTCHNMLRVHPTQMCMYHMHVTPHVGVIGVTPCWTGRPAAWWQSDRALLTGGNRKINKHSCVPPLK